MLLNAKAMVITFEELCIGFALYGIVNTKLITNPSISVV